jgi:outer membrane beta-barrel protein
MRKHALPVVVALALPCVALAQGVGLDLSTPPTKPAEGSAQERSSTEAPGLDLKSPQKPPAGDKGTEIAPLDLSSPPPPPETKEARPLAPLPLAERDVALGDKVKAAQRKEFLKRGRFEVEPLFALTLNDAFYQKFGGGLRLAYSFEDSFALAVRAVSFCQPSFSNPANCQPITIRTGNAQAGTLAFGSQLLASQIYYQTMMDGVWSPIYGKISFLDSSIVLFDIYLTAGAGLVWSATSFAPLDEGPHVATDLGGGIRFYPTSWLAFELGLVATLYPDQPVKSVPGTLQKVVLANIGFSFFFPTGFEYVYP